MGFRVRHWLSDYSRGLYLRALWLTDTESARRDRHRRRLERVEIEHRLLLAGTWRPLVPVTRAQRARLAKVLQPSGTIHLVRKEV